MAWTRLWEGSFFIARVEGRLIDFPMLRPLLFSPDIGHDVVFIKNGHDEKSIGGRLVIRGCTKHVCHHKFTKIDVGVMNHRMKRLGVLCAERSVVVLPWLENPCQNIENESKHGIHGSNCGTAMLGCGSEVPDSNFLQKSGFVETRPFFAHVVAKIIPIATKPGEDLHILLAQVNVDTVDIQNERPIFILFQVQVEGSNEKGLIVTLFDVEEVEEVFPGENALYNSRNNPVKEAPSGETGRKNLPVLELLGEPSRLYTVVKP
ncbi:unnamed protein product [Cuscuta campestris]|uniref:Uncharacterized protein n=1 Tax=Cuscuta campestris TaxID=132261 RepID=A0A484KZD7_9ASTE|nr:unnamed protein product [Cuscuta campestris]